MSALEQPFIDAIKSKNIEGALLEGRSNSGKTYSRALGNRTLLDGRTKPLDNSDILFLASATKLLTTIAVLQCCEKGLLSLDADQRPQLREIVEQGVLTHFDESDGSPVTERVRNALTLRHLLTHSSGLAYPFLDANLKRWRDMNPEPAPPYTVLQRFAHPIAFQPGEGWMYGAGLDIAGHLVEKASGLKLDQYFRQNIFRSVGVDPRDISFFPVKEGLGDRMPDLNPQDPQGLGLSAVGGANLAVEGDDSCYGGHGMYATSGAYIAVLQSLVADDGKLLRAESVAEMFKPQLQPAARESYLEICEGPMGFMFGQNGKDIDYGLSGTYFGVDGEAGLGKGSLGWGGGINTVWFMDPSNGVCGFASAQLGMPPDAGKAAALREGFRAGLRQHLEEL